MIRTKLTDSERHRLQNSRYTATARQRDRVEMVLLSDSGWLAKAIADHLRYNVATVRRVLLDYAKRGQVALTPGKPGFAPRTEHRERMQGILRKMLTESRTWTLKQLADALANHDIHLASRSVSRYLAELGASYKRTTYSLVHYQKPEAVAQATAELAAFEKKQSQAR